jgi:hypothetical protein
MPRAKIIIATLLAGVTLSAVAADSASADWFVSGTKLAAGKTVAVASTAKLDTLLGVTIPFTGAVVTCTGNGVTLLRISAAVLVAQTNPLLGGLLLTTLIIEHCEVEAGGKSICKLEEQPTSISTQPLKAILTKGPHTGEDRATFSPQTKNTIATLHFSEEDTCGLTGSVPLVGSLTMRLATGQSEEASQAMEGLGTTENNSLELGGDKAYVTGGEALLRLASGSKWSFH